MSVLLYFESKNGRSASAPARFGYVQLTDRQQFDFGYCADDVENLPWVLVTAPMKPSICSQDAADEKA
ncbi:MAG: hypothetical protein M3Y27_29880, partial [Acidobacteriota bacterium]|nr:hypothetical protein [Acidobacteriota bacterium]